MLALHSLDLAKWLKMLTPKQRLPIVLAQLKACNTSENFIK